MLRAATFCLALAGLASPLNAAPIAFDDSWEHQRFSLFSANDWDHEGNSLSVTSEGTASLTWKALPEELWGARMGGWNWAVTEGVPPTDLAASQGDDRNLSVYFVFLPEEVAREMSGAPIRKLLEVESVRVLMYVWGGEAERGEILRSAYLKDRGRTLVTRPVGTGEHKEMVNLAEDFARAFDGAAAPALVGIAVSADSDDTESVIEARISDLRVE